MLTVGDKFPEFSLKATVSEDLDTAFTTITNASYAGQWLVVFFWPKDFTFVCPTEIAEFGRKNGDFAERDAQVLGVSVDSEFVHLAWRKDHKDLKGLPFPMLADLRKDLSSALGILDQEGVAKRATFLVDPQGIIRFASVTDMNVGRNVNEVVRVLDALQTDELCPCNWQRGDETLEAA
jgi:peroxiredoxin (alkyl hydroperoxide reductase subunit C)